MIFVALLSFVSIIYGAISDNIDCKNVSKTSENCTWNFEKTSHIFAEIVSYLDDPVPRDLSSVCKAFGEEMKNLKKIQMKKFCSIIENDTFFKDIELSVEILYFQKINPGVRKDYFFDSTAEVSHFFKDMTEPFVEQFKSKLESKRAACRDAQNGTLKAFLSQNFGHFERFIVTSDENENFESHLLFNIITPRDLFEFLYNHNYPLIQAILKQESSAKTDFTVKRLDNMMMSIQISVIMQKLY